MEGINKFSIKLIKKFRIFLKNMYRNLYDLCYKDVLDEKDMEITRLKENLSHSLMQSITSVKEENKTQIVQLNDEIIRRDAIIAELQTKLSEAVVEINESAALIEKLKGETHGYIVFYICPICNIFLIVFENY